MPVAIDNCGAYIQVCLTCLHLNLFQSLLSHAWEFRVRGTAVSDRSSKQASKPAIAGWNFLPTERTSEGGSSANTVIKSQRSPLHLFTLSDSSESSACACHAEGELNLAPLAKEDRWLKLSPTERICYERNLKDMRKAVAALHGPHSRPQQATLVRHFTQLRQVRV